MRIVLGLGVLFAGLANATFVTYQAEDAGDGPGDPHTNTLASQSVWATAALALGPLTTLNSDFYLGAHFEGFRLSMPHVLLVDMAIHTFDTARFISGADPVSVYCKEWNPRGSWYDHSASAVAIFELTGGMVYTYRGSWCSEGLNTSWEAQWRVIGERGSTTWDGCEQMAAQGWPRESAFAIPCKSWRYRLPVRMPKTAGIEG